MLGDECNVKLLIVNPTATDLLSIKKDSPAGGDGCAQTNAMDLTNQAGATPPDNVQGFDEWSFGFIHSVPEGSEATYSACWKSQNAGPGDPLVRAAFLKIAGPRPQSDAMKCTLTELCEVVLAGDSFNNQGALVLKKGNDASACAAATADAEVTFPGQPLIAQPVLNAATGQFDTFDLQRARTGTPDTYVMCWGYAAKVARIHFTRKIMILPQICCVFSIYFHILLFKLNFQVFSDFAVYAGKLMVMAPPVVREPVRILQKLKKQQNLNSFLMFEN